ncbi:MAG: hypothetical protein HZA12_07895 [Nitrospirae bacterium]|nr:hypothetical protein [Nitrospirota bacterium]
MKTVKLEETAVEIDASSVYYRDLNDEINMAVNEGAKHLIIRNVNGQRYIGAGLQGDDIRIDIHGVPGNDMAVFMDGPTIEVFDNAQDGVGNTMNAGNVYVHGHAGDVCGYGMRGGRLYVLGDVGYRVGIHMKAYKEKTPILIVGGTAGHFLGEYMAGGIIVLLGMERRPGQPVAGDYLGTGMHGGTIFVRGEVDSRRVGKEVGIEKPDDAEYKMLKKELSEFAGVFHLNYDDIVSVPFVKLYPKTHRPYGPLYNARWYWQRGG